MGLNIKNPETERLIAELALREGRSKTAVVTEAVRDRLRSLDKGDKRVFVEDLLAIGRECAASLDPEALALDHGDYLYDENGLPK